MTFEQACTVATQLRDRGLADVQGIVLAPAPDKEDYTWVIQAWIPGVPLKIGQHWDELASMAEVEAYLQRARAVRDGK